MLVERLLEHIGDRKGIRIAQALYPEVVGAPGFEPAPPAPEVEEER